jgi:SAM-dependent methyltransferase
MTAPLTCMNCGGHRAQVVHEGCADHYLGKPYVVDYVECVDCGLVQQTPVPSDVAPFYDAYPIHQAKGRAHGVLRRLVMGQVYHRVSAETPGLVLLDYGCGDGSYLESVGSEGLTRIGFELDAAQALRLTERLGVPVYSDAEALMRDHAGRVDIVTMHFVLEHVTDLHAVFALASRLLRSGGVLRIVVPNVRSWEHRLFGVKWHGLDPPRHISFPDMGALEDLASGHGMRLTDERSVAFPNGVAGSVPVVLTGRFSYALFLLSMPLGIVASRVAPSGARAYTLVRDSGGRAAMGESPEAHTLEGA